MNNSTTNNQGVSRIGTADTEKTRSGRDLAESRQRTMLAYLAALRSELGSGIPPV
jgi:hypothetical protein